MMPSKIYFWLSSLLLLLSHFPLLGQTIWSGPHITFERADNVDWNLPENQDSLTENVVLTRQVNQGIYNIAAENNYFPFSSPSGTAWAFGTTANLDTLTFNNWETTINSQPPLMLNKPMVLHLIEEDIFIDLEFTSWTQSSAGGGFTYIRSTPNITTVQQPFRTSIRLSPNPVRNTLYLNSFPKNGNQNIYYQIFNSHGYLVYQGTAQELAVAEWPNGLYFLKSQNQIIRFVKW